MRKIVVLSVLTLCLVLVCCCGGNGEKAADEKEQGFELRANAMAKEFVHDYGYVVDTAYGFGYDMHLAREKEAVTCKTLRIFHPPDCHPVMVAICAFLPDREEEPLSLQTTVWNDFAATAPPPSPDCGGKPGEFFPY